MSHAESTLDHLAVFYRTDKYLLERITRFIAEGLSADEDVIVLATMAHWTEIAARLEAAGIAHGRAAAEGRLLLLEADTVIDSSVEDGAFSVDAFQANVIPLLRNNRKQRIYGEVVSLLAQRGDLESALAIEAVGHMVARERGLHVWCGYELTGPRPLTPSDIARIESAHSRSIREEGMEHVDAKRPVHAVRFYENRDSLAGLVGEFVGGGLARGIPGIIIATADHRTAIDKALTCQRLDVRRLQAAGTLVVADAQELLDRFMVDGQPDARRFRECVVPMIQQASQGRPGAGVRAYGEMVDVLWRAGQTEAAIRLETLWNELAQTHDFALLCGYAIGNFYKATSRHAIAAQHTHVVSGSAPVPVH